MAKLESADFDGNSNLEELIRGMLSDMETMRSAINDLLQNTKNDYLESEPELHLGTDNKKIAYSEFNYVINFDGFTANEDVVGAALTGNTVPADKWGAWAFEVGEDETVHAAHASGNGTGYNSRQEAIKAVPEPLDNHARIGFFAAMRTGATIVPDSTDLSSVTKYFADAQAGLVTPAHVHFETYT